MTRPLPRSESFLPSWQDADAFDSFEVGDEDEDEEEESSSGVEYGSLLGLGMSIRRKKPCIEVDAEEADDALRLVQHVAAQQLTGEDKIDVAALMDRFAVAEPDAAPWPEAHGHGYEDDEETAAADFAWDAGEAPGLAPTEEPAVPEWLDEPAAIEARGPIEAPAEPAFDGPAMPADEPEPPAIPTPAADPVRPRRGHSLRQKLPVAERRRPVMAGVLGLVLRLGRWTMQAVLRRAGVIREQVRNRAGAQDPARRDDAST